MHWPTCWLILIPPNGGGKVTLSGLSAVGGAYVELTWMSTDLRDEGSRTKAGPKEGDRTPLIIVGVAQADKDGNFAIRGKPSAEMIKEARRNDGWVNFMMATTTEADYVLEWVSRHWNGKSWSEFGKARPDQSPSHHRQTLFATDAKTGLKKYGTNPELLNKIRALDVAPYSLSGCEFLHHYYSYAHTVVMEFHNTSDADGHWEYGGTADSTIDAGVKYDGTNWTIGGSKQISNTAGSAIGGSWDAGETLSFGAPVVRNPTNQEMIIDRVVLNPRDEGSGATVTAVYVLDLTGISEKSGLATGFPPPNQTGHTFTPAAGAVLEPNTSYQVLFVVRVERNGEWVFPTYAVTYETGGRKYKTTSTTGLRVCAPKIVRCGE